MAWDANQNDSIVSVTLTLRYPSGATTTPRVTGAPLDDYSTDVVFVESGAVNVTFRATNQRGQSAERSIVVNVVRFALMLAPTNANASTRPQCHCDVRARRQR